MKPIARLRPYNAPIRIIPRPDTSGYLADFVPHIYRHVDERYHAVLHELVQNKTMEEIGPEVGYHPNTIRDRITPAIRKALRIEAHGTGESWRVALVRLYYGIDRCWCQ